MKSSHLKKFWAIHNTALVTVSVIIFFLSGFFLYEATNFNNRANQLSQNYLIVQNSTLGYSINNEVDKSNQKIISGETFFEMPRINMPNNNWDVKVNCTLFSDTGILTQSSLISNISLTFSFGPTLWENLKIYSIEVQPVSAVNVYQSWNYGIGWYYSALGPSNIYLRQSEDLGALQVWSGFDWQDSFIQELGALKLKIIITAYPKNNITNTVEQVYFENYVPYFNKTIEIPSLFVESSQSVQQILIEEQQTLILQSMNISQTLSGIQQEIYEYRNRSL